MSDHTSETTNEETTEDERINNCFGCGPRNARGLRLVFHVEADESGIVSSASVQLGREFQGRTGFAHGGIIATLLDEAMSKLNRGLGVSAMTRHLDVEYLRPVPTAVPLTVIGHHLRREGRKLFHAGEIRDGDGDVLARGKGLFIVMERYPHQPAMSRSTGT